MYSYNLNSLWIDDTIWRQRSGSTLADVMAWCRKTPSYYLNQCLLFMKAFIVEFRRVCSEEVLMNLIRTACGDIAFTKLRLHLPVASELKRHVNTALRWYTLSPSIIHYLFTFRIWIKKMFSTLVVNDNCSLTSPENICSYISFTGINCSSSWLLMLSVLT